MKIGVYGNCQTEGIANCIRAISPGIEVFNYKVRTAISSSDTQNAQAADRLAACDVVLAQTRFAVDKPGLTMADLNSRSKRLLLLPLMNCRTLQPDCAYLFRSNGAIAMGPMNVYHSSIVAGAYKKGLERSRVPFLFNKLTYTCLGYLGQTIEKQTLARDAVVLGYDLSAFFNGSRGRFMHTVNHPGIAILFEIALQTLAKIGTPIENSGGIPADALARRPIWPIYPGIATNYMTPGESFVFRESSEVKRSLRQFIVDSYKCYDEINGDFDSPELKAVSSFIDEHVVLRAAA